MLHSTEPGSEASALETKPAPAKSWNRRRFLAGVAGGVAAVLAACGKDRATPTPTAPIPSRVGAPSPREYPPMPFAVLLGAIASLAVGHQPPPPAPTPDAPPLTLAV